MTDLNTHQQYVTKWEKTHRIDSKKKQHRAEPGGTGLRAQISGRVRQEVWKLKVYAGYKMGHKSAWQPAFIHKTTDSVPTPTQANQDKRKRRRS